MFFLKLGYPVSKTDIVGLRIPILWGHFNNNNHNT